MVSIIPELGAAGCGHPDNRCEYLAGTLFGFSCKKYDADLKLWKGEPIRLRRCGDDAHKEWAKLREEQKRRSAGVNGNVSAMKRCRLNDLTY